MTGQGLDSADRIVVGVDWTRRSVLALQWAAAELLRRGGGDLVAVHACGGGSPLAPYAPVHPQPPDGAHAVRGQCEHLTAVLAEALGAASGLSLRPVCDLRPPVPALLSHGTGAAMLVLAAGRPTGHEVALGSTALACIRNAPCPVVLLPVAG